jgi:hypothetical protein
MKRWKCQWVFSSSSPWIVKLRVRFLITRFLFFPLLPDDQNWESDSTGWPPPPHYYLRVHN